MRSRLTAHATDWYRQAPPIGIAFGERLELSLGQRTDRRPYAVEAIARPGQHDPGPLSRVQRRAPADRLDQRADTPTAATGPAEADATSS